MKYGDCTTSLDFAINQIENDSEMQGAPSVLLVAYRLLEVEIKAWEERRMKTRGAPERTREHAEKDFSDLAGLVSKILLEIAYDWKGPVGIETAPERIRALVSSEREARGHAAILGKKGATSGEPVILWRGRKLETLSKEELIGAVAQLFQSGERMRESHRKEIDLIRDLSVRKGR